MPDFADCKHPRQTDRHHGTVDGGPRYFAAIDKVGYDRSWAHCLDCGIRLERATVSA